MAREKEARFAMLEKLADYDDELLEQLLTDMEPPRDRVFADLAREVAEGLITPVLFGSAENGNGILRLLKALRHEAPGVEATCRRLGLESKQGSIAQVLKTFHTAAWRQAVAGQAACRRAVGRHRSSMAPAARMPGSPACSI